MRKSGEAFSVRYLFGVRRILQFETERGHFESLRKRESCSKSGFFGQPKFNPLKSAVLI